MKPAQAGHPIRVLHLRDSAWLDGPARTIAETGEHFDKQRIEYHVGAFVPSADAPHEFVSALAMHDVRCHRIVDRGGFDRAVTARILDLVDRYRIEVLHCSDFRTNLFGLWCERRRSLRTVCSIHGWIANDLRRKVMRFAHKATLRGFDEVVAVSDATLGLVPAWWLPRSRTHVLRNALVVGRYGARQVSTVRPPIPVDGSIRIANIGRLSPEKGQLLLLRSLAGVLDRHPRVTLQIVGIGPLEGDLRDLASGLGIESSVRFLGYRTDMPAIYADSDLIVQSSLTEGLPNVVLEAAFLRVPVIATDVGGTSEIIEDGRTGRLIEPGSVERLRDSILEFIEKPASHVAMAKAAHERVRSEFTMEARTERMTRIYEHLVHRAPAPVS